MKIKSLNLKSPAFKYSIPALIRTGNKHLEILKANRMFNGYSMDYEINLLNDLIWSIEKIQNENN